MEKTDKLPTVTKNTPYSKLQRKKEKDSPQRRIRGGRRRRKKLGFFTTETGNHREGIFKLKYDFFSLWFPVSVVKIFLLPPLPLLCGKKSSKLC
jgi:hypothetical protein